MKQKPDETEADCQHYSACQLIITVFNIRKCFMRGLWNSLIASLKKFPFDFKYENFEKTFHTKLRQRLFSQKYKIKTFWESICDLVFLDGETDIDTLVLLFGETGQVNRVSKLFSFSYENLRKHFTKNMLLLDFETWWESICELAGVVSRWDRVSDGSLLSIFGFHQCFFFSPMY